MRTLPGLFIKISASAVLILMLAGAGFSFAASATGGEANWYWVSFTDKDHNLYSLNNPGAFLSSRAIARRQAAGIPLTINDVPVNPAYVQALHALSGIEVVHTSRWFNGALIAVGPDAADWQSLGFLSAWELVKPARAKHTGGWEVPDKMLLEGFHASAYQNDAQISQLNALGLTDQGYNGKGIIIAVLDAGFLDADRMQAFHELRSSGRLLGSRDFVNPGGDVFREHAHGTQVLSIMAAHLPGVYRGVATGAGYWLLRTEDTATEFRIEEYNWLVAAEFADSLGADIIQSSLGYSRFDASFQDYTPDMLDGKTAVISRAAGMAAERGMLVVSSAGNYGQQAWRTLGAPADAHGIISVGAVDFQGNRTGFSSTGPSADGRVKPELMALGREVSLVLKDDVPGTGSGTSFAAPLISGLAASLWEKHPHLRADGLRKAIIMGAANYHRPDFLMGYGIPDFEKSSDIISGGPGPESLVLFPNPVTLTASLGFFSGQDQIVHISLYDINGLALAGSGPQAVVSGYNQLDVHHLFSGKKAGTYFLRLEYPQGAITVKAVKSF